MSAETPEIDGKNDKTVDIQNSNESSLNLLRDLNDSDRLRRPPVCISETYITEEEQKKYKQNLDETRTKLHEFPVSKELRPHDIEVLHQLQDAILSAGSLGRDEFSVDPSKFVELAHKLDNSNYQKHAIIQNLNASLAQYGIKAGHTTGEISLMMKDPTGQATNWWMVVHANGKPSEAFFTDERDGRFFPLDPAKIFTAIQNQIVKQPELSTRYGNCDDWRPIDPIWPPPHLPGGSRNDAK